MLVSTQVIAHFNRLMVEHHSTVSALNDEAIAGNTVDG